MPSESSGDNSNLTNPEKSSDSIPWGDLKNKEREEALQLLKEKFPGRYTELIENYYKSLAEERKSR